MKKLFTRLFRKPPPPPPSPTPRPAPQAVEPPQPAVDPAEAQRLIEQIEQGAVDASELARLAVEGPTSKVRLAAATAIVEPDQLHALLPRVRGKDKSVYKHVKQKCDALLAEQRKAEALAQEVDAVCEALERHGKRAYDALYVPMFEALTTRWAALPDTLDADARARGQQALDRATRSSRRMHAKWPSARPRRPLRLQSARLANAQSPREHAARQEAMAAQAAAREEAARAAAATREAATQADVEQQATIGQAQREIGSLIRLCGAALQRGDSRKAARFRASLEEAMQAAPALPPYLARNLQQLDERLNELRQWKDYVVAPKRIELIEEMEALIGVDEEPEALAEHIRALQQEWRTVNKGIAVDTAVPETERFQQAFQAAFKPCQAHFAAQAAVRREHLEARKQVVERLKAFAATLEGEAPDYPFIVRVLREAPLEWRSHFPVDRDAGRAVEAEYHQALDRLRAVLNGWHESNAADKQALIAQARHLATVEDSTQAIDGVKRLQMAWKETGPVAREQHQALWEEFRTLCDAVYERRQQAFAQYSATLEAAKSQAVALCEQVEQASGDAAGMEKASAHAQAREWQAAFEAIGELPRNDARSLRERFDRAVTQVRDDPRAAGPARRCGRRIERVRSGRPHPRVRARGDAGCD